MKQKNIPWNTWWRHDTLTALLALCEGNPPVTDGFPHKGPVMQSFNNSFDVKLLNKQSKCSWIEMSWGSFYANSTTHKHWLWFFLRLWYKYTYWGVVLSLCILFSCRFPSGLLHYTRAIEKLSHCPQITITITSCIWNLGICSSWIHYSDVIMSATASQIIGV